MKKWLTFALVMGFMAVINLTSCDSGGSSNTTSSSTSNRVRSVNDCCGVYIPEGIDSYYLTLNAESHNEFAKCGEYHTLYRGNDLIDKIYWGWDKRKGVVMVSALDFRVNRSSKTCEIYIDVVGKKIYSSYGEFLDKRNGISYTFKKQ